MKNAVELSNAINLINVNLDFSFFSSVKQILKRKLKERGCTLASSGVRLKLTIDSALSGDTYLIDCNSICASNPISILAGVGRYLVESSFEEYGKIRTFNGSHSLKAKNTIRGIYFATHFYNFYHVAPIEKVCEIIEDISLRGCNALLVWFDMHQYTGINDAEALAMIDRLKSICNYAKKIGMAIALTTLANESFAGSPEQLKAQWQPQNGYKYALCGHYHEEICPSVKGGMDEIIRQRREVFNAFRGISFDYISIWPYDQGGCTCKECAPWGANGFLKIVSEFYKVMQEEMPDTRILCSTWHFNQFIDGEWKDFYDKLKDKQFSYIDYLFGYFCEDNVPDFIKKGDYPGGLKMLSFPEISMRGAVPWGGFGTNAQPAYFERQEKNNGHYYDGGFAYSEGIYEDINKAIILGYDSGRYDSVTDIIRDYIRFEFCTEETDEIVELIFGLETSLPRTLFDQHGKNRDYLFGVSEDSVLHYELSNAEKIVYLRDLAIKIDKRLSRSVRNSWRWRIVYLRALIDYELYNCGGTTTEQCEKYYAELSKIYYAEEAYYVVSPPSKKALLLKKGSI